MTKTAIAHSQRVGKGLDRLLNMLMLHPFASIKD